MNFLVACNWDEKLVERLNFPEVTTLFGGLPNTVISGGRYSAFISNIDQKKVRQYIQQVHNKGFEFSFNLNSPCLGNKEYSAKGYAEILEYLETLVDMGVDSFTISLPSLLEIVKENFPQIKTKISTFQKIHSVAMAKRFEDLGADAIMLSEHINRDFDLIRAIRKAVKIQIVVIANVGCIYGCPSMFSHANSIAHSGNNKDNQGGIFSESYSRNCIIKRYEDTVEFIKSRWIRPEDLDFYESLGIDTIKIIDRNSNTEALINRVKAYSQRSYEGNLIDLMGQMINTPQHNKMNVDHVVKEMGHKGMQKASKALNIMAHLRTGDLFYLDNKKIPSDFIEAFQKRRCTELDCDECRYCHSVAKKTLEIKKPETVNELLLQLKALHEDTVRGTVLV